jgi:tetratricopeptide (TPR) repeat protein
MADVHWTRGRYAAADEALRRAIEHARYAGATWEETESLGLYAGSGVYGRVPIAEIERRCSEVIDAAAGSRLVEAGALRGLSVVRAMEGRFDEAREFASSSRSILEDLGLRLRAAFVSEASAFVERQAGDPAAAERALRAGLDVASEVGEQGFLATATALLAHELIAQGRLDEAESLIDVSEEATAEDDLTTQVLLMDLSRVLDIAGRPAEVGEAIRHAIELYRAKGNTVSTHAAERRLAELSRRR